MTWIKLRFTKLTFLVSFPSLIILSSLSWHKNVWANPWKTQQELIKNTEELHLLAQNNPSKNRVGRFILMYNPASSESTYKLKSREGKEVESFSVPHQDVQEILQKTKVFDGIIEGLNDSDLVIRQDIYVSFEECGEANAYWSPKERKIIICYENTAYDIFLFHKVGGHSLEKTLEKSINETIFAFYHELGHALIDVLSLNAVGQEEDTVDEFASIMLLKSNSSRLAQIVLDSAEFYQLSSHFGETPAWDEHTPNSKRLFNLVCFVYGSNPEQYAETFLQKLDLLSGGNDIEEDQIKRRAAICAKDYQDKVARWNKLLLPHYATQNRPWGNSSPNTPSVPSVRPSEPGRVW